MKTLHSLLIGTLSIAACGAPVAGAQVAPGKWADTVSTEIETAQLSGDVSKIQAARALAERVATAYPADALVLHYAGYALLREAQATSLKGGDATPLLQRSKDLLSRSAELRPLAETYALISSVDGQMIDADPSRAMELGMASQASMSKALALGPKNPRVWLTRGQSAFFTPPEYGGGVKTAQGYLERAAELFASDTPKPGEPSWGRAEVQVWLGQVYDKEGDAAKATRAYRAAVDLAPDYVWARALLDGAKRP
jgi:tetratricopeptide (TPR) repeat protein